MKNFLCIIIFMFISSHSFGGDYQGKFMPYWNGANLFIQPIDATKNNVPPCATKAFLRLQEDVDTDVFKMKYSLLLAMWMAGREIQLVGTGDCTSSGYEIISGINRP